MIKNGVKPVIQFNEKTLEHDYEPDPLMRARVESIQYDTYHVWILHCDLTEFEEFNKQFERRDFKGYNGETGLLWRESPLYPKNKLYKIYIDDDEDDVLFDVLDDSLFKDFQKETKGESYIEWLENQVKFGKNVLDIEKADKDQKIMLTDDVIYGTAKGLVNVPKGTVLTVLNRIDSDDGVTTKEKRQILGSFGEESLNINVWDRQYKILN